VAKKRCKGNDFLLIGQILTEFWFGFNCLMGFGEGGSDKKVAGCFSASRRIPINHEKT
jgi:hypothetical protein